MAAQNSTVEFNISLFLQFLFSVIFLFVCCFMLMLYVLRALAFSVGFLLRFLVLPRNIRIGLTGLHFAPLQGRILFRDFVFQTENLSLRIVDGYVTFAFWGFWFKHPRWSRVHEYMVCKTLVGTRCRVRRNLAYVKGTVVAVDVEKRKVSVQFDEPNAGSSGDDDEAGNADTYTESHPDPLSGPSGDLSRSLARDTPSQENHNHSADVSPAMRESASVPSQQPQQRRTTLKEFNIPVSVSAAGATAQGNNPHVRSEGLGDEVVKMVDANDVYVRSRAGLFQIHLNGLHMCIYNATGKYLDLAKTAAAQATNSVSATAATTPHATTSNNGHGTSADAAVRKDKKGSTAIDREARKAEEVLQKRRKLETTKEKVKRTVVRWVRRASKSSRSCDGSDLDAHEMSESPVSVEMQEARKLQEHNILNTSFMQKFFNFIGCVELEVFSAHVDLGAVAGTHPYFLHITFHQGEGRLFLTKDSCPALDLYRFVSELTLRDVDMRMAQMNSKLNKTQVMRNATLYERARLLFSGVAESYEHLPFETESSSNWISQYGVLMDGKDKGTVHLVCYKDAANVYAGEPVRRDALPTTGVEVLIDTPVVRYGPWLEYCRTQLWQYFLPPNYMPLQELQFSIGAPRPNAGFELLVLFMRETKFEVPFKRRSIVPSPPFGIKDSKRKGTLVATIGAGAQYIQPAFFLLPNEEKQVFQGLFIARDVTVWTNCVLDREATLCHADSVQFFFDRQDDRLWNGRKLFNILTKLSGADVYWYMVYVDYFLDLLNDWQFAASMYHGAPLTTELFNTLNRCVRDFIPNVKRFEIFVESTASFYINVNTNNVVYSEDPNDMAHNMMATVKVQSGRFSVVLPNDQYQLSYENDVSRPLEASAHELKAYLSLPTSHPLYEQVSTNIPWAYSETFKMSGLFVAQVQNQSIPLSRDNMDTTTGRTKLHNDFTLDLEFTNLRGTLMGTHINALIQFFQNVFLDNTFPIEPDELFWLLAKLQSHATVGKNKRKEFKQFLEQSQPAGNDMEICVTVRLIDVSATVATGQAIGSPQVNLSTGLVTFTYVKQFAVTDTGVSLSPITVRFPNRHGVFSRNAESNIVVGAITVSMTKHFGRMPLKPKVHESMEIIVDGASLEVTAEQLMLLAEVAQTVGRHFMMEDMMMEAEVADALSAAELLAEKVVRAGPLRNTTDGPRGGGARRRWVGSGGAAHANSAAVHTAASSFSTSFHFNTFEAERRSDSDEDKWARDGVEMQEWRTARRAAAMPHDLQLAAEPDGDEEEAHVNVPPPATATTTSTSPRRPATSPQEPLEEFNTGGGGVPILHSYEFYNTNSSVIKHGHSRKRRRLFFADSSTSSAHTSDSERGATRRCLFASTVPYDVALGFANFMEECNKADDDSKDYGLFFMMVDVGSVNGVVSIGELGYASLELPMGLTIARSTVNDGNSNKRLSAAAKHLNAQLMLKTSSDVALSYLPSLKDDSSAGHYLEVMSLHTSLCLRQYVAYPFDNSLENHCMKQKQFVVDNDYEHLISFPFKNVAMHHPPTGPRETAAAEPSTNAESNNEEIWSPVSKAQSTAAATPEPATIPRLTAANRVTAADQATVASVSAADAANASAHNTPQETYQASGFLPLPPPTTRAWIPAGLSPPIHSPNLEHNGSAALPVAPRDFAQGDHSSELSSDSHSTMAHQRHTKGGFDLDNNNRKAADGGQWNGHTSLSDTMHPTVNDCMETSNRFETCVSVSTDGGSSTNSTENFFDTSSNDVSPRLVTNRAFAADRRSSSSGSDGPTHPPAGRSPPVVPAPRSAKRNAKPTTDFAEGGGGGGGGSNPSKSSAAPANVPPHLFYRAFNKAESDDKGVCAMDYWPPQRPSGAQKVRNRTGFHAQLPTVGFYADAERQTLAPAFFSYMKQEMLQKEEDLFAWARCIADNCERSKHNSTSRHLHIALMDPLTVLVTPEAVVMAAAAARLFLQVHVSLHIDRSTNLQRVALSSVKPGSSASLTAASPRLLRSHTKSKARTHQKRWLWDGNMVSVSVPTIEVKALTRLPVPVENLPNPSDAADGVYTSTILVRNLRGVMAQNRPPRGEEVGDTSQKVSASLKLDTFAVVTQIEWEPMSREGNLLVKVPSVWYDSTKPSIAVLSLTQLAVKGKRDMWRGSDGGACNITTAQIASHVTRDFADYVTQLLHLSKAVNEDVQGRLQTNAKGAQLETSTLGSESSSILQGNANGRTNSQEWNAAVGRAAESSRVHNVSTVQGRGFLESVTVTLIDTERVGAKIVVKEKETSRLELLKPFCSFAVVIPNLLRDQQVHVQGVGEMSLFKVHLLPSVLHVIHPGSGKPNPGVPVKPSTASPPCNGGRRGKVLAMNVPTFLASSETTPTEGKRPTFRHIPPEEGAAAGKGSLCDRKPLQLVYDGTFTVHQLDVSAKHSGSNYARLLGKELTGCAESRIESVASRECVQTEALTETISERLKVRLRYKAKRAKERAKRSRYPAPPDYTEQLYLHSTASFFAHQLQLHYVAECAVEPIPPVSGPRSETSAPPNQNIQKTKIFSANISSVALVAQFASQFNACGHQTNLHMIVRNVVFDLPYCLRAAEMLHPQVNALVSSWREAVKAITKSMRRDGGGNTKSTSAAANRYSFSFTDNEMGRVQRSSAVTLQVQATSITGYIGLPQGVVQKFLLPQISCFTKSSSNGRVDLKLHLHPFTITDHNTPQESYRVVLPHVYVLYGHDPIKMLCSVTMGTIAITITPFFINHILMTYSKFINDVLVVVSSPPSNEDSVGSPASASPSANGGDGPLRREDSVRYASGGAGVMCDDFNHDTHTGGAPHHDGLRSGRARDAGKGGGGEANLLRGGSEATMIFSAASTRNDSHGSFEEQRPAEEHGSSHYSVGIPRRRRRSFLFLLQGVRLSYLTSMTTLRFTIRSLNATADTTEGSSQHTLHWVVNVTDVQAALVDRDDHDQMVATYKNLSSANNRASTAVVDVAQAETATFSNGRGVETANTMKAAHPLGGFLWGSVGLSLTLSSGKVDDNRFTRTLQNSTYLGNYSEELQQALIESFTNSASKWELSIYEPLVIMRVGLDALLKQCVRETQEDVREMKRVSYEESLTAKLQLHRLKRFQRLQTEKKRIDRLLRQAQKERQQKLRSMTKRVVHDMAHRRGGLSIEGTQTSDAVLDFFSSVKSHMVVATVTRFMVVVPFGDAPFRRILEALPDTFACGMTDRHIHTASCLNRRKFIPSYALKLKVSCVSFACNLEVVKRLVPVLLANPYSHRSLSDSVYTTGGSADQDYSTTVLFIGRLSASDSHIFFTDGSPLRGEMTLNQVLRTTSVLGGQGILTSYAADEHERSLNRFAIASIEAPLRVERKSNMMTVGVVVDVSEPKGFISSLFLGILREFSLEHPTTKLGMHIQPRRRSVQHTAQAEQPRKSSGDGSQHVLYSEEVQEPTPKDAMSLHLDITGRIQASELAVYCYSNPERFSTVNTAQSAGGAGSGGGGGYADPRGLLATKLSSTQRRVGFNTASTTTRSSRWQTPKDATADPSVQPGISGSTRGRYLIMSLPLPGVTVRAVVRRRRGEDVDDVAVVRAELCAGTMELSPYIAALAQEVEMCTGAYVQQRTERNKRILAFVQEMEEQVSQLGVPLHCALAEVLLPMPRAFAGALAREEMNSIAQLRRTRAQSGAGCAAAGDDRASCVLLPPKRRVRGFTAVHLTISDFRLVFNTDPAASTCFTVYLDKGGTIDFIFKHFIRSDAAVRFLNKFPDVSLTVALHRLRAECQTKLEVRSLELFLPEADLSFSRRSGSIGVVDNIAAYFPFNVEGMEPNLTVRLLHVAQLFLVVDMWSSTISETLRSVRHLFALGAAGDDIAKHMARTQLGRQMAKGNNALREMQATTTDRRTIIFIGLSHALCFCDIGAGSSHNFTVGEGYLVAEATTRVTGCSTSLLISRLTNTSIRSEGVLSGGMLIGGIFVKGFIIQNAEDAETFVRTPEQRTFRETLLVQQVHVNFKERQLKDVFECKIEEFSGNSMDGIGEEDYTTTDLDLALHRSTLGVTPSTVPAVLGVVRNISAIVAEQRRVSNAKLEGSFLCSQPPRGVMKRPDSAAAAELGELGRVPWPGLKHSEGSETSRSSTCTQPARRCIPYFGNKFLRVPCGEIRIMVDDTTVLLGAISSGEATAGCVVASFAKGRLSFAECPCDDYQAAKKILAIETHKAEFYRPGTPRVVVIGFQGVNHFEFYTRQVLGSPEVGFTLTLRQTNPWTGNPRFRDFEEMIQLIKSFTDKKNADVIKHFGHADARMFDVDMSGSPLRRESGPKGLSAGMMDLESQTSGVESKVASPTAESVGVMARTDERRLKALRSSKFSPQLRFGGDVSVNTEVILNWLGVTEKMLPHVVHTALCDKLEKLLSSLSTLASERVRPCKSKSAQASANPPSPRPAKQRAPDDH